MPGRPGWAGQVASLGWAGQIGRPGRAGGDPQPGQDADEHEGGEPETVLYDPGGQGRHVPLSEQ